VSVGVALGVAGAVHAGIATYATELSDLRVEKERVETIEQGQTFFSFEITRFSRQFHCIISRLKYGATVKEIYVYVSAKIFFFFFKSQCLIDRLSHARKVSP